MPIEVNETNQLRDMHRENQTNSSIKVLETTLKPSQMIHDNNLDSGLNKGCSLCIIPKFVNKSLQIRKKHLNVK